MQSDNIMMLFTYLIATILIVGGLVMLFVTRLDPPESDVQGLRLLIAGFIGGATQYVFNKESTTQATRAAQSSFQQGQPTITTSGDPPTTTVTPSSPDTGG